MKSGLAWHCEDDNYPYVITVLHYLRLDEGIVDGNLRYKDNKGKWLYPEEVVKISSNKFLKKDDKSEVNVGLSESMSKSKRNTVDPQNIINNYGADSVRLFILSDSPPEKDVQLSESGMSSSFKFIQKFWFISDQLIKVTKKNKIVSNNEIDTFTNQAIDKINYALDRFRYNVIIAVFHEIYSFFKKILEENKNFKNLEVNFIKVLIVMTPVIPHLTYECLNKLTKNEIKWPDVDQKQLIKNEKIIVIQINGKKRNVITIKENITEDILIKKIKEMKLVEKYISDKKIIKTIYVKDKLINIIVK